MMEELWFVSFPYEHAVRYPHDNERCLQRKENDITYQHLKPILGKMTQ